MLQGMDDDVKKRLIITTRQGGALNVLDFTNVGYFRIALRPEQISELTYHVPIKKFCDDINGAMDSILNQLPRECKDEFKQWYSVKTKLFIGIPNDIYVNLVLGACPGSYIIKRLLHTDFPTEPENPFLANEGRINFVKQFIVVKLVRALHFSKLLENESLIPAFIHAFGNRKELLFVGLFENILFHASDKAIHVAPENKGSIWRDGNHQEDDQSFLKYLVQDEDIKLTREERERLILITQKGLNFCRDVEYRDEYDQDRVNEVSKLFEQLFEKPVEIKQVAQQVILEVSQSNKSMSFVTKLFLGGLSIGAAALFLYVLKQYGLFKRLRSSDQK